MKLKPEELRLYAVTDRAWTEGTEGVCRQVEAAVRGGATFVQLREKHLEHDEFLAEASSFMAESHVNSYPFICIKYLNPCSVGLQLNILS